MNNTDYPSFSPYLAVHDAEAALAYYNAAFGAVELYRLVDSTSGKIGHAELTLNGHLVMLSEENPAWNKSPRTLGGTAVKFCLMVDDPDSAFARAVSAGAEALMPPRDEFYGFRSASVRDPFGHEWMLQKEIEKVSPKEMQRRWDDMIKECGAESAE